MSDEGKVNVTSHGQTAGITAGHVTVNHITIVVHANTPARDRSINPIPMSIEALRYMNALAAEYVKWEFPNHRVWNFDTGADDAVHNELRALGLMKLMGTRGAPWVLTDRGQQWVMANRPWDEQETLVNSSGQTGGVTAEQVVVVQAPPSRNPLQRATPAALEYLKAVAAAYVERAFPNHKCWWFDPGGEGVVHNELRALGMIKLMGTKGAPWCLTDAGHAWVMANRP